MDQQGTDYDRILGPTRGLLAERGDEQAVALMVDVQSVSLRDTNESHGRPEGLRILDNRG